MTDYPNFPRVCEKSGLMVVIFLFSLYLSSFASADSKVFYPLTDEPIDVVIPCTHKDLETLELCIEGIRNYGSRIRRVIIVSEEPLSENAEWFDEKEYPFSKYDVALALCRGKEKAAQKYLSDKKPRVGWYFQQLLKLYAPFVIPDISSNVLILDADTIFLNPVEFQGEQLGSNFNPGVEYHPPYFKQMNRLIPWLKKLYPNYSGISHHMLFQRAVLEDLFHEIKNFHNMEPWRAFCHCVDSSKLNSSGASEYEIYFNFAFSRSDQMSIRPLKWKNRARLSEVSTYQQLGCHYVTCHSWMRK